ncbi:short chain dehydrogenase [Shewanella sp. SNU WT4]|uniref:NAD(P)H-binding protein n=1 Tax=Shewanella sp. SNU WT4 TaxID=2590015 RepID=UPI00112A747D|nr:NAD(P)H-binding protein [Shewanella sp. SNU WT4]QDF66603.1 short chain dehydrogenase [Shewanella sp. SNU WT4]
MGKIAIVLGATGAVGRELVQQLSQTDGIDKVVAITRSPVTYANDKIINEVIDFNHMESFASVFAGDIFCSCLGTTLKQAGTIFAQRQVDVDYQYRAATLARAQGVSQYLLVSASGANASSRNAYLKMKGELEQLVIALHFARTVVIQPSLLLGDRSDFRLGEVIGSRLLPWLCKLPALAKYRPITGRQVAQKMRHLVITAMDAKTITQTNTVTNNEAASVSYHRLDKLFDLS